MRNWQATPSAGPAPPASQDLLFTPGPRLGWVFRDRRELAAPYPEPEPSGLPSFGVPPASWPDVRGLLAPALTVALICVAQTAATVRAPNAGAHASMDFNRDLADSGPGTWPRA